MLEQWMPTGWWRAVLPDGSIWCESSDEHEVRISVLTAPERVTIQRHMRRTHERWDDALPGADADE